VNGLLGLHAQVVELYALPFAAQGDHAWVCVESRRRQRFAVEPRFDGVAVKAHRECVAMRKHRPDVTGSQASQAAF